MRMRAGVALRVRNALRLIARARGVVVGTRGDIYCACNASRARAE